MKNLPYLIISLLLLSIISYSQESGKTEIYHGRGELNNPQKILDFSHQNLKKFPIQALSSDIEVLILDNNNISKLPPWIGKISNLKVLSLRNNKFKELDFGINDCNKLEQLYLSGNNELADISTILSTSKLHIIDVSDTKINKVPVGVAMMDHLFYFKYTKKKVNE